jgi:hypothetical protein
MTLIRRRHGCRLTCDCTPAYLTNSASKRLDCGTKHVGPMVVDC